MISKITIINPCSIVWKGTFSTDYFNITLSPPDEFKYDIIGNSWTLNPHSKEPKAFSDEYIKEWLESHKNSVRLTLQATNDNLF